MRLNRFPRFDRKYAAAYGAISVFLVGLFLAGFASYKTFQLQKIAKEQAEISRTIYEKRLQAMEEARKEGKSSYSFTLEKPPIAISQ